MEILLSWFILVSVLLNFVLIEEGHQVLVRHAFLKSIALLQAENMLERLRVNKSSARRQDELAQWNDENKHLLPQADGFFYCSASCVVTVKWHEAKWQTISLQALVS